MKKLTLFFTVLILAMVSAACVVLTACNDGGEKLDYTVTVLDEDEISGVPDVTVKWSNGGVKATATTDEDGRATASIAAATYTVTLENLPEGMTCDSATVTSSSRGITLVLEKATVDYTVTVNKNDGTPASGVTVTWRNANSVTVAEETTDSDGKASTNLVYGDYKVTLSNLPAETYFLGVKTVTGAQPDATFDLQSGTTADFSVTVKSEGGLKFKKYTVTAYSGSEIAASSETNDDGTATVTLPVGGSYTVRVENVPEGYTYEPATLSVLNPEAEIIISSKPIEISPASDTRYLIGDIIHDYEFTTPYDVDGKAVVYKISKILKTKKAIVLNFWGTNCSACMLELPAMQQAYEIYSDDVEILAVSNYMGGDTNSVIAAFHSENEYGFPMFRDTYSFTTSFALNAWPTNVIIDRYGAIARIEDGALTSVSFWQKLLEQYIGDDYVQTFVPGLDRNDSTIIEMAKPDVTVDADHYDKVAAAINNTSAIPSGCSITWYGEPEETAEYTWPFMLKTLEGNGTVLYPSNTDHDSTFSFIYADVTMKPGKVFAFDYWSQTEESDDIFYVLVDSRVTYAMSGENDGWKTCYVYADILAGKHQIALSYIKDESRGAGFDNVYIKNARFVDISEITQSTNMLRGAAYGVPAEGESSFPYYATVELSEGYYYVDLSSLTGTQYAGNDEHPMLFANFTSATNWNELSLEEMLNKEDETNGEYEYDCYFKYDGKTEDWRELLLEYVSLAGNSEISGYLPVDEELRGLLKAFVSHISGKEDENEWLKLCYFYSHYGSGNPVGNPIIGITDKTAIEITAGQTYTADLTRFIAPFPIKRYHFTPDKSGVYKIESLIEESAVGLASQVWVYTDDIDSPLIHNGEGRFYRDGENEQNFVLNMYLTKGQKYYIAVAIMMSETGKYDFQISYVGESTTVLSTCASGDYVSIDGHLELRYTVEYEKDGEYYRVRNSDGTLGDFIYVDFKYPTLANTYSLSTMINQYIIMNSDKLFKVFDFSKMVTYYPYEYDEEGAVVSYNYGIVDLSDSGMLTYEDYTAVMENYSTEALRNGGLLKVTDELIEILSTYFRLRTEMSVNGEIPESPANEWLQFCWYNKTIDANNPV